VIGSFEGFIEMPDPQTAPKAPTQPAAGSAVPAGQSYADQIGRGAVSLPGLASKNPNAPIMKILANLVKGALMAVSLGMGPGQMLFFASAAAVAGSGRSVGPLAHAGPASPILSASSAQNMASRGLIAGTPSSLPSARVPL
jgi:hypothetical protein